MYRVTYKQGAISKVYLLMSWVNSFITAWSFKKGPSRGGRTEGREDMTRLTVCICVCVCVVCVYVCVCVCVCVCVWCVWCMGVCVVYGCIIIFFIWFIEHAPLQVSNTNLYGCVCVWCVCVCVWCVYVGVCVVYVCVCVCVCYATTKIRMSGAVPLHPHVAAWRAEGRIFLLLPCLVRRLVDLCP